MLTRWERMSDAGWIGFAGLVIAVIGLGIYLGITMR